MAKVPSKDKPASFQDLVSTAYDLGAYKAKLIDPDLIAIEHRAQLKCLIPRCTSYNKSLTCPPNTPNTEKIKKIVAEYSTAIMVQVRGSEDEMADDHMKANYNWVYPSVYTLHKIIHELEVTAFDSGYYLVFGLGGGDCRWCEILTEHNCSIDLHANAGNCQGIGSGKCVQEYKARPALEAMSINVVQTAQNAGLPFHFSGKEEGYVIWNGILLID